MQKTKYGHVKNLTKMGTCWKCPCSFCFSMPIDNIIYIYIYNYWLVVSTSLKNISQLGLLFPNLWKKNPNHQPVYNYIFTIKQQLNSMLYPNKNTHKHTLTVLTIFPSRSSPLRPLHPLLLKAPRPQPSCPSKVTLSEVAIMIKWVVVVDPICFTLM